MIRVFVTAAAAVVAVAGRGVTGVGVVNLIFDVDFDSNESFQRLDATSVSVFVRTSFGCGVDTDS